MYKVWPEFLEPKLWRHDQKPLLSLATDCRSTAALEVLDLEDPKTIRLVEEPLKRPRFVEAALVLLKKLFFIL